jgi:hypothetical protein
MSATAAAFVESGHGGWLPAEAILSADPWSDDVPVPSFGPRMVCTRCGIIGADARPNWCERPARLSGAGTAPWQ